MDLKPAIHQDFGMSSSDVTQIEHRTDLSLLYRVLRACIRPLRPRLVGLKPPGKEGSPQIPKRPSSHKGVRIVERKISVPSRPERPLPQADGHETQTGVDTQTLWVYDFEPERSTAQTDRDGVKREWRHTIYYFAGGGFQAPGGGEHWKLCAKMAADLAEDGVRVVLVSYPLAPASPAKLALPLLQNWLLTALQEANNNARTDEHVTLMGDSAGGNIVVVLAFWWCEQLELLTKELEGRVEHTDSAKKSELEALRRLTSVVTISPPTDFRNSNPAILEADKLDPILTEGITQGAADAWCKTWEWSEGLAEADPALSPALASKESWQKLRDSRLVVHGLYGTADRLAPDCKVFMDLCKREEIPGKWLVWERQMHCFPLTQCYGMPEGKEGLKWLESRVREGL